MTTHYLPYRLTLRAPALLTSPDGDPNSARTLGHVPGAAIRGAVARATGARRAGDPQWDDLRELVLDGKVRYLHAYPLAGGRRSLPAPLSLRGEKGRAWGTAATAHDLLAYPAAPGPDHDPDGHWPEAELGGGVRDHLTLGAPTLQRVPVAVSGRIHQARDRRRGRAWADERETHGAVFAYESIDAGQDFGGVVVYDGAEPDRVGRRLAELLGAGLLVGRSRRAGYGGDATIAWEDPRDREVHGRDVVGADVPAGTSVRLLLTSPYLGRDTVSGQPDPTSLPAEITARLPVTVERVHWAFTEAGGHNRTWGLDLPQRQALAAGSVLLLRCHEPVPLASLLDVEHAGLGERRLDGFGRCAFLTSPIPAVRVEPPAKAAPAPRPPGEPPPLVRSIEQRIALDRLGRRIEEIAGIVAADTDRGAVPSPSLLARLRTPLRGDPGAGLATLRTWLTAGEQRGGLRRPARDQLDRCIVTLPGGRRARLGDWLTDAASDAGGVLDPLRLDAVAQQSHLSSEETLRTSLDGPRLRARLVDAVLAALSLRARGTQEGEDA